MTPILNARTLAFAVVICFGVALLSACGQKGDLYLPENIAPQISP